MFSCQGSSREKGILLRNVEVTRETKPLFDMAKRTGSALILSKEDVMSSLLLERMIKGCENSGSTPKESIACKEALRSVDRQGIPEALNGVREKFRKLPTSEQRALERQAGRFLDDAQKAVQKLRAEAAASVQPPPDFFHGPKW